MTILDSSYSFEEQNNTNAPATFGWKHWWKFPLNSFALCLLALGQAIVSSNIITNAVFLFMFGAGTCFTIIRVGEERYARSRKATRNPGDTPDKPNYLPLGYAFSWMLAFAIAFYAFAKVAWTAHLAHTIVSYLPA